MSGIILLASSEITRSTHMLKIWYRSHMVTSISCAWSQQTMCIGNSLAHKHICIWYHPYISILYPPYITCVLLLSKYVYGNIQEYPYHMYHMVWLCHHWTNACTVIYEPINPVFTIYCQYISNGKVSVVSLAHTHTYITIPKYDPTGKYENVFWNLDFWRKG